MSDQPENLTLVFLRRIDGKLDRLVDDVQDLKHRVTATERLLGEMQVSIAGVSAGLDRLDERTGRIERRFDLAEA